MNYSWYSNQTDLNSPDTIHQILAFGKLDEILKLRSEIGREALCKVFLESPKKLYSSSSLNFIKKFILNIDSQIDDQQYSKSSPRYIR